MKLLRRIFMILAALLALLCGLIFLGAVNPKLSENMAQVLYPERTAKAGDGQAQDGKQGTPEGTGYAAGAGLQAGVQEIYPEEVRYLEPDAELINIPEKVAGRNGYQEVADTGEQIEEPEEAGPGYGETGDDLSFDPRFYPHYAMLDEKLQKLYRQIYANAQALNPVFEPVEDVTGGELKTAFEAVCNDHPELFFMDTAYAYQFLPNGSCARMSLKFNETADRKEQAAQEFEQAAEAILSGARGLSTDYEKEKYVHDALNASVEYDLNAPMNQSAYSALCGGRTVCAGYARAYQYMLQQLGIPCYYCTGSAGESHAWNIVELDGEYYNVDTTWDDTDPNTYNYFNKTDQDYSSTHIRKGLSIYLPACNGETYRTPDPKEETTQGPGTNPEEGTAGGTGTSPEEGTAGGTGTSPEKETTGGFEMVPQEGEELRTLEETGLTADRVFTSMDAYYQDCYAQMDYTQDGVCIFQNVIEGDALLDKLYADQQNEEYYGGYLSQAVLDKEAYYTEFVILIEELEDDRYLLTHSIVFY